MNKHTALGIILGLMVLANGQTANVNVNFDRRANEPSHIYLPPMEGSETGPITVNSQWITTTEAKVNVIDEDGDGEPDNAEAYTAVTFYETQTTAMRTVKTPRPHHDIAQAMVEAGELAPAPNGSFEPWQPPEMSGTE